MGANDEMLYEAELAWRVSPEGRAWSRGRERPSHEPDDEGGGFEVDLGPRCATATPTPSAEHFRDIIDRLDRIERGQTLAVVKEAYTTAEAAERLGRAEWTVRQWCNKGQVPGAYKVRGKGRTGEWRLTHESVAHLAARGPDKAGTHPSR